MNIPYNELCISVLFSHCFRPYKRHFSKFWCLKTCSNGVCRAGNIKKTTQTQLFMRYVYFMAVYVDFKWFIDLTVNFHTVKFLQFVFE